MDDMRLKFYTPVVTGNVANASGNSEKTENRTDEGKSSFQAMLEANIEKAGGVNFSKHAVKRAADHQIELTDESLERLNKGVQMAQEKQLTEPLILVGQTAFLVNVKNNTVITTVNGNDADGKVFTNIDGTVIV